jgi:hypothetical protein
MFTSASSEKRDTRPRWVRQFQRIHMGSFRLSDPAFVGRDEHD